MSDSIRTLPGRSPLPARIMAIAASTCGHVDRGLDHRPPALLYVAPLPDHHGDRPREEEHADDRVAENAEVERREPFPDVTAEGELLGHDLEHLDAADHQRDRH